VVVVATPFSCGLAARVARRLGEELLLLERRVFPDGELCVRIPSRVSGTAVIVGSLYPPQERRLLELLLGIEALRGAGASEVVAVVPYLAYARQDKRFREGEPVSVKIVLKSIEAAGACALVTVDVHNPKSLDEWLAIPHVNIVPYKAFAEYVKGLGLSSLAVLAPDKGALHRAEGVARLVGAEFDYVEKRRDRVTGEVTALPKELEVEGRDVVIVDDIISTGGTIALAAKCALEAGAKSVYAACTHALLVEGALDRIYAAGVSDAAATDTVPSPISKISVAEELAEALLKLGL